MFCGGQEIAFRRHNKSRWKVSRHMPQHADLLQLLLGSFSGQIIRHQLCGKILLAALFDPVDAAIERNGPVNRAPSQ